MVRAVTVTAAVCSLVAPLTRAAPVRKRATGFSWATTNYLFAFGDSYTASGYNVSNGILSPDPIIGWADGYTWAEFLAHVYNETDTQIFNFAFGGATVDNSIVEGTAVSLSDQVLTSFGDNFVPAPSEAPWTSDDSLFTLYIGINDVDHTVGTGDDLPTLYQQILDVWESRVSQLYTWGARNFLVLDVPPVDRSPFWTVDGPNTTAEVKAAIAEFNDELYSHVTNLTATYPDALFMLYEDSQVYGGMLDDPAAYNILNSTEYCDGYAQFTDGPPSNVTYLPECGIPVLEYFFLDALHPSGTVHREIAKQAVNLMANQSAT